MAQRKHIGVTQKFGANSGTTIGGAIGFIGFFLQAIPLEAFGKWTFGDALIFGLLATTIGVVWDIRKDVRRISDARDRSTRLMVALEGSDMDEDPLIKLCESAGKIRGMAIGDFARNDIDAEVLALATQLDGLADDETLRLKGESRLLEYINQFTLLAKKRIDATSAVDGVDDGFWSSGEGKDYLSIQKAQIEDQIVIRRIFFTEESKLSPSLIESIKYQESIGIEVGVLVGRESAADFIVYDDFAVIRTHLSPSGRGVAGGTVLFRKSTIEKESNRYDTWWDRASRTWNEIKSDTVVTAGEEFSG